ncbi:hypothetical protein R3P38DRAFT_2838631 [Favolaschia claudopus]|uniref:Uncharacterized protein n=1 Tax=Favolaschia claudopus TaxID=2862362 RepID=A0AAW0E533_9AGAR
MPLLSWPALGVEHTFDPHHKFVSSPVFSPYILAAIRCLLALYGLCTICTVLAFDVKFGFGDSYLSYFTNLSYIGLTAYYWASGVQTFAYARYGRYPLRRWPRVLQGLHVLLQSTVTTFPFIVTVVFWVLLSSSTTLDTKLHAWQNISVHAMNSAFALFDILLTNTPPAPWLVLPLHIIMLGGYLGVAYITHETQGFYTYSFLDPSKGPILAAYIIGIAVGDIVVFLLARGAVALRQRLAIRAGRLPDGSGDAKEGARETEAFDEWQEIDRPKPEADMRQQQVIDSAVAVGGGSGGGAYAV